MSLGNESTNSNNIVPLAMQSKIDLPACRWNEDQTICSRSIKEEAMVLEIYLGYSIYVKNAPRINRILNFDESLLHNTQQMHSIAMASIDSQVRYSDHLMERIEAYEDKANKARRKGIIQNVIWGTAGVGLGILVGAIIGVLGANK